MRRLKRLLFLLVFLFWTFTAIAELVFVIVVDIGIVRGLVTVALLGSFLQLWYSFRKLEHS